MRRALVAMSVWKFTMFNSAVSISWHCMMGPVTRTSGSWGNTIVPSGIASISTDRRRSRRYSRKAGSNKGPPAGASSEAK